MPELRGLTLWRPWPSAFVECDPPKRLENRTWAPPASYAGSYVALHAGKVWDSDGARWIRRQFGELFTPERCPPSSIVAVARYVGTVEESQDPWFVGPVAWRFDQVTKLPELVECPGGKGLWPVPPAVLAKVREGWRRAREGRRCA